MLISGDDVIRNIPEQVAENTENIQFLLNSLPYDPSNYYDKDETDALLAAKADSSDVYTKDEVDSALAAKANADDVYTKAEADAEIAKFYVHTLSLTDENSNSYEFKFVNKDPEALSTTAGYFSVFANYMQKSVRLLEAFNGLSRIIFTGLYLDMPYIRIIGLSTSSGDGDMWSVNYQTRIESASDTVTLLSNLNVY